jgi:thymidylate synthase
LAGTDKLKFIEYYIPRYAASSDDGKTIHGAYGPRLFRKGGIDQVATVTTLLRDHADSRRAVIQLFDAADIRKRYKDVPCTCTLQFLLRNGRLDMVVNMRSNDAVLGLPHDIFTFTMVMELIARSVHAEVGQYYHMVGSLHLYQANRRQARQYLREGWQPTTMSMPPMPSGSPWRSIRRLLVAERAIRKGYSLPRLPRNPYWRDLVRLLQIFRMDKNGNVAAIAKHSKRMHSKVFAAFIASRQQRAHDRRDRSPSEQSRG